MRQRRPEVIVHSAVSLDGATSGFTADVGVYYSLAAAWREDVTLTGADTVLAQATALADAGSRPGPRTDGPLLAVVDSRERVTQWEALRNAGHWRDAVRVGPPGPGPRVDLADALDRLAREHDAKVVRVDSGGGLSGALLRAGLVSEISLVVHPVLSGDAGERRWYGDRPPPPAQLEALGHQILEGGLVWLRYRCAAVP